MLNESHSFGVVRQSFNINAAELVKDFRQYLLDSDRLIERSINYDQIKISPKMIDLGDIKCRYLICAEGWGVRHNPYFQELPFRPAKGEVLIVKIEDSFPQTHILKYHKFFVPQKDLSLIHISEPTRPY